MSDHMDARTRDRLKAFCKVGRLFELLNKNDAVKREDLKTLLVADRMRPMARAVRESLPWV